MNFFLKVVGQLGFRDSADSGEGFVLRNIPQLIQIAENTDLLKFCYPRDKDKLNVLVKALQGTEKSFEDGLIM